MREYFVLIILINAAVLKNEKRNKTILISFDGMRWDYLDKYGPFKNFDELRKNGVYTDGLQSQFVTKARIQTVWFILYESYHRCGIELKYKNFGRSGDPW